MTTKYSGQVGLESHVDEWVEDLRTVMRELHRVLLPTGSTCGGWPICSAEPRPVWPPTGEVRYQLLHGGRGAPGWRTWPPVQPDVPAGPGGDWLGSARLPLPW